jgi:hypothetical protein
MKMRALTIIFFRFRAGAFLALAVALLLTGCGSARYRSDYNGFNAAYADSSNRQMLLNLARLDQHDPTYFLQFGQISVQYNFTSSINGTFNNTIPQSTQHVPIVGEVGVLSAGASTTPSFTFIPVADDKVAQELLNPVPANVLYTLFQQGAPVDQLLRLMVERFEIQLPGQSKITTYSNSPGQSDPRSYATFLKICAIAREFQKDGNLKLLGNEEFVPLAEGWTSDKPPEAKDLLAAEEKQLVYKLLDGKWELGKNELVPKFVLAPGAESTVRRLQAQGIYGEGESMANMQTLLTQGFSVEDYTAKQNSSPRLVLRSFLNILAAAAQEQTNFGAAIEHTALASHIPPSECRPILRLRWDDAKVPLMDPLIALDYHGKTYEITDPVTDKVGEEASWNRDVFRLLTELASQVSVDISKFPLPTSLQVLPTP